MVNPEISISNGAPIGGTSSYDAVDLLEDSPSRAQEERYEAQRRAAAAAAATDTSTYTIDSEEGSTDGDGSSEEGGDSSDNEGETSSDDDDLSEDDDDDNHEAAKKRNGDTHSVATNSVAATEVMGNLLKNPSAQHYSSPRSVSGGTPGRNKSIIPPASSFKNIGRRFPTYLLKGKESSAGKDKRGKHQRLATDDDDDDDGDEESNNSTKKVLMDNPVNKVRDPAQFPMEQYNDKKYGMKQNAVKRQDFGSYSYTTAYSSSDPSNVAYEPQPLRRMPVDLSNGMEEKKRKIVFYGFLTAIIICFCIAVGSIITHANRHHVLSPPPSLENVCDISNISTKQGHEDCEHLCEEAKCCMAPGINSCFEGQEEICRMYAPCAALYSTSSDDDDMHAMVPPAPANLPQLCSHESIMYVSGYIQCNAACQAGRCCNVPDKGRSSIATGGLIGWSVTPISCVLSHPELCAEYGPCDALSGALMDVHGKPHELVQAKCTPNKIKTEVGVDECESACQTRACCFANSSKKNCYDDNQVWCDEFKACKILTDEDYEPGDDDIWGDDNDGGDDEDTSVTARCTKDYRALSAQEVSMCKTICLPVSCCFYDDIGCTRNIDCEVYSFCSSFMTSAQLGDADFDPFDENIDEILPPSGGQHSPAPSQKDVEKACQGINSRSLVVLHPFHQMNCGRLCSNYMCCFEDDFDPASCHEETTCQKYVACKELISKKDESPDDNDESPDEDTLEVCSIDNISKIGGYTQCEEHCRDHMCCFSAFGCNNYSSHHCEKHETCRILATGIITDTDIHGKAVFNYGLACSKEVVYGKDNQRHVCSAICEKHKCCWDDKIPCSSEHGDCSPYEPCDILQGDDEDGDGYYVYEDDDSSSLEVLKGVCKKELVLSPDAFFAKKCVDACEDAKCCYDNSCEYNSRYCALRTACSSVSQPTLACSGDLDKGIGEVACKNACDIYSCCWKENGCYSNHESECMVALQHCTYLS